MLGHNQISMTMDIYSHVMPTLQQEAMNKLNQALQGGLAGVGEPKNEKSEEGQ